MIRPSRGKDVVAEFLGEVRPDFWVSDRYGAQMGWAKIANQVCLSHYAALRIMPPETWKPASVAAIAVAGAA